MFPIGAKLGVIKWFHLHVGCYYGNGLVFHMDPQRGPELVSLQEFSSQKQIVVLSAGVDNLFSFYRRVQDALGNSKAYNLLTNNCEHVVSLARDGVSSSPQLNFYAALSLFLVGVSALAGRKSVAAS